MELDILAVRLWLIVLALLVILVVLLDHVLLIDLVMLQLVLPLDCMVAVYHFDCAELMMDAILLDIYLVDFSHQVIQIYIDADLKEAVDIVADIDQMVEIDVQRDDELEIVVQADVYDIDAQLELVVEAVAVPDDGDDVDHVRDLLVVEAVYVDVLEGVVVAFVCDLVTCFYCFCTVTVFIYI